MVVMPFLGEGKSIFLSPKTDRCDPGGDREMFRVEQPTRPPPPALSLKAARAGEEITGEKRRKRSREGRGLWDGSWPAWRLTLPGG